MRPVRIHSATASAPPQDAARIQRISARALELVGRQLAMGDAVAPRSKLTLDVAMEPGISEEQMARRIARELARKLL